MYTTYKLKLSELNEQFLDGLKMLFRDKQEVEIAVYGSDTPIEDETTYLMKSKFNRERLLQAIQESEEGKNLIIPEQSQFQ
ncbi:MAG: hypothetical protein KGZ58_01770 [Ignavibacteriales bacterium]|nr:hypothetical protein [Ignavibacteriales bacterium]